METLEGHTLVDGTVGLDIDVVTILIATHVSGERNDTMFTEVSLKHVTSTSTITVSVRHCLQPILELFDGEICVFRTAHAFSKRDKLESTTEVSQTKWYLQYILWCEITDKSTTKEENSTQGVNTMIVFSILYLYICYIPPYIS